MMSLHTTKPDALDFCCARCRDRRHGNPIARPRLALPAEVMDFLWATCRISHGLGGVGGFCEKSQFLHPIGSMGLVYIDIYIYTYIWLIFVVFM